MFVILIHCKHHHFSHMTHTTSHFQPTTSSHENLNMWSFLGHKCGNQGIIREQLSVQERRTSLSVQERRALAARKVSSSYVLLKHYDFEKL